MKRKFSARTALFPALLLSAAALAGCAAPPAEASLDKALGLDLAGCTVRMDSDTHGGFHGDGETAATLTWEDGSGVEAQIAQNSAWQPLPLPAELTAVFYGYAYEKDGWSYSWGPLAVDEDGAPLFPAVENGYYFFLDRHSESADPESPAALWDRTSFNFTAALYDADRGALYYYALDT